MDISAAALPPRQPAASQSERSHPRYAEWRHYVSAMSMKLLEAAPFHVWLRQREERGHEEKHGKEVVFHTKPGARLPAGWYKHKFAPHTGHMTRFGPFETEAEAAAA